MATIELIAPLAGWCAPLDEVPDPVFAQRLLGHGVAIDPTSDTLHAPCAGEILSVAATKHAVAIRSDEGVEVLMHVGIETVALAGAGFEPLVAVGARVSAKQPLLRFDLDVLASSAKSLITPIVITNGHRHTLLDAAAHRVIAVGQPLMRISAPSAASSEPAPSDCRQVEQLVIPHEHGIHARPAALIAHCAKQFEAVDISIEAHGRTASARSAVALMTLGVRRGDEIKLVAEGKSARDALRALREAILSMPEAKSSAAQPAVKPQNPLFNLPPQAGEGTLTLAPQAAEILLPQQRGGGVGRGHVSTKAPEAAATPSPLQLGGGLGRGQGSLANDSSLFGRKPAADGQLRGVIASRGLAAGRAVKLRRTQFAVPEFGAGIANEEAALERARAAVRARLQRLAKASSAMAREVMNAHLEFLEDAALLTPARRSIEQGHSAAYAWRNAIEAVVSELRRLDDERMRERIDDLLDLDIQVLGELLDAAHASAVELPEQAILIAEDLKPSQLVALDASRLAAICLAAGGPTSHVALLAAAMEVPALVALGKTVLEVPEGAWLIVDAEQGLLTLAPDHQTRAATERTLSERRARRDAERSAAQVECRTADGTRIEVFANLASVAEASLAVQHGAEGCGLLRTEFLFLERQTPPDEEEQLHEYQAIATALHGRPLIIRTLDIGGDKPIPYLPLPAEENPALGLRGVRTSLWRPDLLRTQLRAILRVRPPDQCRILLPMITDAAEVRTLRRTLEAVQAELHDDRAIQIGAMVETPASALLASRLVQEVDFLSIGTNDLTQYTLAMDRGHSELAHRIDGLHPAVLSLIARVTEAGSSRDTLVAVCGGLASDPLAVPILIGLGVRELSVVPTLIPQIKAAIRHMELEACQRLAAEALQEASADAVRALAVEFSNRVSS